MISRSQFRKYALCAAVGGGVAFSGFGWVLKGIEYYKREQILKSEFGNAAIEIAAHNSAQSDRWQLAKLANELKEKDVACAIPVDGTLKFLMPSNTGMNNKLTTAYALAKQMPHMAWHDIRGRAPMHSPLCFTDTLGNQTRVGDFSPSTKINTIYIASRDPYVIAHAMAHEEEHDYQEDQTRKANLPRTLSLSVAYEADADTIAIADSYVLSLQGNTNYMKSNWAINQKRALDALAALYDRDGLQNYITKTGNLPPLVKRRLFSMAAPLTAADHHEYMTKLPDFYYTGTYGANDIAVATGNNYLQNADGVGDYMNKLGRDVAAIGFDDPAKAVKLNAIERRSLVERDFYLGLSELLNPRGFSTSQGELANTMAKLYSDIEESGLLDHLFNVKDVREVVKMHRDSLSLSLPIPQDVKDVRFQILDNLDAKLQQKMGKWCRAPLPAVKVSQAMTPGCG